VKRDPKGGKFPAMAVWKKPRETMVVSVEQLTTLDDDGPKTITRHMNHQHVQSALNGDLRFGTTREYGAGEKKLIARLGDDQEGRVHEAYDLQDGVGQTLDVQGMTISPGKTEGFASDLVIISEFSDYCCCASIGDFSDVRLNVLRNKGNKDLDSYVTYDLGLLKQGIKTAMASDPCVSGGTVIGLRVSYREKDRMWSAKDVAATEHTDQFQKWLISSGTKDPRFSHEDEYRIMMVDHNNLGGLDDEVEPKMISSKKIAEAIVGSGILPA
jgi:hypothetical protein